MLTTPEIKSRIEKPKNGDAIKRGLMHSRRLKFHGDMQVVGSDLMATYMSDFKAWVKTLLPAEKYDTFCSLILTPIQTNELTETIYNNLSRVFEGKNQNCAVEFKAPEKESDFAEFFDRTHFRQECWRNMRSDIDAVIVCDLPSLQEGEYPEPYFYFISTENLIDICVDGNTVEYVIFSCGDNEYVTVDDTYWRKTDRNGTLIIPEQEDGEPAEPIEIAHNLGYCPARMLWTDKLTTDNEINHKAPLTAILGDLDRLLFNYIAREYADMYAGFPIVVTYDFDEEIKGDPKEERATKGSNGRDLLGPGSLFRVRPPQTREDIDLNANPVQVIGADVATLEYLEAKNSLLRNRIFKAVVGAEGELKNDAAKNEKQIEAGFESRADVLMNLKHNFENAEDWAARTLADLRYGPDAVVNCVTDYGTEFYLYTSDDALQELNSAKQNNAPDTVVSILTEKYMDMAYRSDPQSAAWAMIIRDLDPLPNMSAQQAVDMAAYLPDEDVKLKVSMDALIARFERENPIGLIGFGSAGDYNRKIETINEIIRGYVRETSAGEQAPGNPGE
jgi:hypothetical protein